LIFLFNSFRFFKNRKYCTFFVMFIQVHWAPVYNSACRITIWIRSTNNGNVKMRSDE
jgi:hypothetical protein